MNPEADRELDFRRASWTTAGKQWTCDGCGITIEKGTRHVTVPNNYFPEFRYCASCGLDRYAMSEETRRQEWERRRTAMTSAFERHLTETPDPE